MVKSTSKSVLAIVLALGCSSLLWPQQAASAPKRIVPLTVTTADGRQLTISAKAAPAVKALETAVKGRNDAAYPAALAAAQSAATTPDEKYVVAKLQLEHSVNASDAAGQAVALQAVLASGFASPTELGSMNHSLGILAFNAGDWQRAEGAFAKAVELNPANTDALVNLALTRIKLGRQREALPLLDRAVVAARAAGQPVQEAWLSNALRIAFEARTPDAARRSRDLLAAYPTPENWRNTLGVYREAFRSDEAAALDIRRLMRAAGALQGSAEHFAFAEDLIRAGLVGEAKAVLEDAVRTGAVQSADPTYVKLMPFLVQKSRSDHMSLPRQEAAARAAADSASALRAADLFLGYGEHAKAAALYRSAMTKKSGGRGGRVQGRDRPARRSRRALADMAGEAEIIARLG
jgi:tetratricopeptide (TPR) repeat protein